MEIAPKWISESQRHVSCFQKDINKTAGGGVESERERERERRFWDFLVRERFDLWERHFYIAGKVKHAHTHSTHTYIFDRSIQRPNNLTCYTAYNVLAPTSRTPLPFRSSSSSSSSSNFRRRTVSFMEVCNLLPEDSEEVHVLAVDDSLVDRKVIERLLRISACKVTAVDSGIRALQFLGLDEQKSPSDSDGFDGLKVDLIITDYCMPGMTGYELLKKIKESSTFREIPVVIMSSENVLPRIDRCLEEGAEDFIVKPVKLSDVKRLRDYMTTREVKAGSQEREGAVRFTRRKLTESSDLDSSPPSFTSSSALSSSPSDSASPSPSSSPSSLDSPITRLGMTSTTD